MSGDLVTPDQVEQDIIDLLARRHEEHLAKLERQLGLEPETIERLATRDLLQDTETLPETSLPAVRLALTGLSDSPVLTTTQGRSSLTLPWVLELDVMVQGRDASDGMLRVRWTAMTVAECLLQRLPRRCDPVERLDLVSCDFQGVDGGDRGLGRAEMRFTVVIPDALTVRGGLPVDTTDQPPAGGPGGAPETPYTPPVPWPDGIDIELDIDREPLAEEPPS